MLTLDPPPDPGPAEEGFDPSLLQEWDETGWWADLAAAGSAAVGSAAAAEAEPGPSRGGWGEPVGAWQRLARALPLEEDPHDPGVLDQLSDQVLLDRMAHAEALSTQLAAAQARLLGVLRQRRLAEQAAVHGHQAEDCTATACCDPDGWVAPEVGPWVGLSERQLATRLDTAERVARFPAVAAAMTEGRLQAWTATRLLEHLDTLGSYVSAGRLAALEAATVAWLLARPRTVAQLNTRMRRLILAARAAACQDGEGPDGPDQSGHQQRRVTITPAPNPGLAELVALLPEADALAVRATLATLAHDPVDGADPRTADQRRADLLVTLLTGRPALNGRPDDTRCALRDPVNLEVRLDVSIPADSLVGHGPGPGRVPGYGDIPSATARDLVGEAARATGGCQLRPLVYHPDTGRLLGFATTPVRMTWLADLHPSRGYRHSPTLHTAVRLRDGTCRAPGCPRPAARCDCDHVIPYPTGPTSLTNSCSLCRRHHRLKTHAPGWHLTIHPDGHTTWTTPTGTRHTTHPTDHRPPDHHPDPHPAYDPDTDPPPF